MRIIDNVPYEERFQAIDNAYSYLYKKELTKKESNKTNIHLGICAGLLGGIFFTLFIFFYSGIISLH